MKKFENKIIAFLKNNFFEIIFFVVTVISLLFRASYLKYESEDYTVFLKNWFDTIKESGGIFALGKEIGNYNIPYIFILAILSYIPIDSLISIKMVSIIFDYLMAFVAMLIVYEILKENKNKHFYALIVYTVITMLPTLILNSSAWAQCDSIYTTFILLSLLFTIKEKYVKAFIFFGISFSIKMQAIFILPVLILLYLSDNRFSIYNFFIIPLVNLIMCLPAIIMGRSLFSCLAIYLNQTGQYGSFLSMNIPNIYAIFFRPIGGSNLIWNINDRIFNFGIFFTLLIFAVFAIIVIIKRVKINKQMILYLSLWSVLTCIFFLPSMHDRYMYIADVVSVIIYIIYRKKMIIPILINFISLYTYIEYLYAIKFVPIRFVAIINCIVLIMVTKDIVEQLIKKEEVKLIDN